MATSFNRNPLGSNQYILRTDEEIQAIIDSYPDNWTKKDFRGEGKLNKEKKLGKRCRYIWLGILNTTNES